MANESDDTRPAPKPPAPLSAQAKSVTPQPTQPSDPRITAEPRCSQYGRGEVPSRGPVIGDKPTP